ncbi:MAG TPA: hydroxyacid dehydrogenase [Bacillota bacterium]|nr:hydroxyacid dehydrogenase [Bacillota bacterium]
MSTKKPKAVFICRNMGTVLDVYSESVMKKLCESLDFIDPITKEEDIYTREDELSSVEYAFSTWGMIRFSTDAIRRYFPLLRAVFYAAGSVQGFAREFLDCGVAVFSAWGANAVPVAQFTYAQIILSMKGYYQRLHNGGGVWSNRASKVRFPGFFGDAVGIIGAGMIGRLVIDMLRGTGVRVLVYDKFLSAEEIAALGGEKADLADIFSTCCVISNHLANNPATVGMLNYSLFSLMRDGATFINTGRGAQVVEADLVRALTERPSCVALLDVTDPEPPAPDSPLLSMENVFLSPHIAGSIGNEVWRMAEYMYDEFVSFSTGKPVRYRVTKEMLETMA